MLSALGLFALSLSQVTAAEFSASTANLSHDSHVSIVPDFDHSVAHFDKDKSIFNQVSYEETVHAQAEMLVTLEALAKEVTKLQLDLAHIETLIYGNSNDAHDNMDDVLDNREDGGFNRHTYAGMAERTHILQDKCYYNQHQIDDNRHALWLYCQQFAFAPDMVGACGSVLSCKDTQLPYRYSFHH